MGGNSRAGPGQLSQSTPSRSASLETEGVRVGVGVGADGSWLWGCVKEDPVGDGF